MQNWIKGSALTISGVAALWYVATRPLATLDAAPASPAASPVVDNAVPAVDRVIEYAPASEGASPKRNPFGYVEQEPEVAIARAAVASVVRAEPPSPSVVATTPEEPPPPRFEHRYIGYFGPDRDLIATFSLNGEIVTVRRGDRIGDRFVLHTIGLESVEVADGERIIRVAME